MIEPKLILITLLVKLGVAAAVSSALARSETFKDLLLSARRTPAESFKFLAWVCVPLTLGVWVRVSVPNFLAADLSFEATVLLGLLTGPWWGMLGGLALAVPAVRHHEYLAPAVNLAVAAIAGTFRHFAAMEDIWSFSPLIDLSIYRWVRRNLRQPQLDRQIFLLVLITGLSFVVSLIGIVYPRRYFALYSAAWPIELAICLCSPVVVGIPLKIWHAIRIERKLKEQERLLLDARLDALQRQINPHFLFNTLNSIASLVRFKPELAREMIVKLANILRTLLKHREAFVPFSEELAFTEDYLAIEVVRFGEKLKVVKEIAPESLPMIVPSMLLQPLIENSIKHGLEPRISGGTITLRSRVEGEMLVLEVEDDGVGMTPERDNRAGLPGRRGNGIGLRNVRERVEMLYGMGNGSDARASSQGPCARIEISSRPGRGTHIAMWLPLLSETTWPQPVRTQASETER
ncbi:MAG: sensor histidine kinase [Acidobacteriaceae bacterium]|nr:sensor histidine kinase [Acidobacteriaceae bacterium]